MGEEVEKIENKIPMVLYIIGSILLGGTAGSLLRVLDVMAGRTLSTFVVFLGVALAGMVLGAVASFYRGSDKMTHTALFSLIFLAAAGYLIFIMNSVNGISSAWQRILLDTSRTYSLYLTTVLKTSALFIMFYGVLAGAGYVTAFRSKDMTFSFSWSSCGALAFIVGWWLFGSLCISLTGLGVTLRLIILLFGLMAALTLLALSSRTGRLKFCAVLISLLACSSWFLTSTFDIDGVLSEGTFGRLVHRDSGFAMGKPVLERSSLRHTVSVYDDPDYKFVFALDGRPVMFGSRFHTSRILSGYVPLIIRPETGRVLLAGSEAGLYAPFFVRAGVKDISYCGAERSVVQLAIEMDAELSGEKSCSIENLKQGSFSEYYDLVYLTPEPVYMRGSAGYFSKLAFHRASSALKENGITALHLDARGLSQKSFASVAGTMRSVFPYMQIWCTGVYDWVLVGSHTPVKSDAGAVSSLLGRDQVFQDFVRAGNLSIADAVVSMICDERGLDKWLEGSSNIPVCMVSWDAANVIFDSRVNAILPGALETVRQFELSSWFLTGDLDSDVYDALAGKIIKNVSARMSAVIAVANMANRNSIDGMRSAREAANINLEDVLLIQLSETLELEARRRIKIGDYKGAIRCYENLLSFAEGSPQAHYGMGYCLRANGDSQNAYIHFARAVVGAPDQSDYRLEFAEAAIAVAQFEVADKQYEKVLEGNPDDAQTLFLYAKALGKKERQDKDYDRALKMAEKACRLTKWENLEIGLGLADLYMDAGRVMEGMGLRRTLKAGQKPQL
ncbi:MAG: tetratricopeptide repeat protein [Kiritimatiellae bacterium]|nr:tetratricopeptide repeat protein [Kiritimatiellia bacterium]